ncbi:MAG: tetratricopeptide repeat protein, partial [Azoarcus sp.]|nr:tetratricopeptide repeat protein [Azoarcus sp.]
EELKNSSIVVCQGRHGWDDYLLLYHYDSTQEVDEISKPVNWRKFVIQLHKNVLGDRFYHAVNMLEGFLNEKEVSLQSTIKDTPITYAEIRFDSFDIKRSWYRLKKQILKNTPLGNILRHGAVVICQGNYKWDDYLLFHHYHQEEMPDESLRFLRKEDDVFDIIFRLEDEGFLSEALGLMLTDKKNIRDIYADDVNRAWYVVGCLYNKCGIYKKAIDAFHKSLKIWPKDIAALRALGDCYADLNLPKIAERYYRKAIRLYSLRPIPKEPKIMIMKIRYGLGKVLYKQGKFSGAICEYRKIPRNFYSVWEKAHSDIVAVHKALSILARLA